MNSRRVPESDMRMPHEVIYVCLLLMQLLDLVRLHCPAVRDYFDIILPTTKTPVFRAVPTAGVKQRNKNLKQCRRECASNGDICFGFNYKEPQLVCELFLCSPFTTLTITPGCTYYEVSRNHCSGAAKIWRWGHKGSGERRSPAGPW